MAAKPGAGRRRRERLTPEPPTTADRASEAAADGAAPEAATPARPRRRPATAPAPDRRRHYHVYVVYLRDPKGDGRAGYYVGMTGLTPDERLVNHLSGNRAARIVRRFGVRLVPSLYAHLNPMTYDDALRMEGMLADSLRKRGFQVFGGH
jgi:hypothetical protein